jgi:hypothetical protein
MPMRGAAAWGWAEEVSDGAQARCGSRRYRTRSVRRWADTAAVANFTIRDHLLRTERRARYLPNVRDPLLDWWMGYLDVGAEELPGTAAGRLGLVQKKARIENDLNIS